MNSSTGTTSGGKYGIIDGLTTMSPEVLWQCNMVIKMVLRLPDALLTHQAVKRHLNFHSSWYLVPSVLCLLLSKTQEINYDGVSEEESFLL